MISFQAFRQTDGTPIYLQILRYIQQGLAAGTVRDGDELPSRRVVSALLAVNPNTVQKAFRLLEDEGLVVSRAGAKSYVQASPQVCRERDPQGLYAAGEDNIPGESFPYDVPLDADLVIDTQALSVEDGVKQVLDLLRERQAI